MIGKLLAAWRAGRTRVLDRRTSLLLAGQARPGQHPHELEIDVIPVPWHTARPRALTGARLDALEHVAPGVYRRRLVPAPLSRLAPQNCTIRTLPGAAPVLPGGTLAHPDPSTNPEATQGTT